MRCFRAIALLSLLGCVALCTLAAAGPAEDATCRTRTVPVTAFNSDGNSAPQFSSANLVASYDEKAVRVTSVAVEQQPRQIILLLDLSGSMLTGADPAWKVPLEVGRDLLGNMPPDVDIGLAVFSGHMIPLARPTRDRQSLLAQLQALRVGPRLLEQKMSSGTALWDSLIETAGLLQPPQPGDVIYVVTDGADNLSRADSAAAAQALASRGIRLFCFGIINGEWMKLRNSEQVTGATELTRVMEATGGWGIAATPAEWESFQRLKQPPQFERDMNNQFRQLKTFYRVNLELPEPLTVPQDWRLLVTGLDDSRLSKLQLIYPHRLMPCSSLAGATSPVAAAR